MSIKKRFNPDEDAVGKFVSIWWRKSRRHKWRIEYKFVLVTRDDDLHDGARRISWQTSMSGRGTTSGHSGARLGSFSDGSERKIDAPSFDVELAP